MAAFSRRLGDDMKTKIICSVALTLDFVTVTYWKHKMTILSEKLNEDGELWDPTSVLPAGLMAFYGNTKPLDKSWHVMGLGYNPSISPEVIRGAAVIHFNGNMKPWLDVAFNQYKALWTKHVDTEMEFLTLCNFGL